MGGLRRASIAAVGALLAAAGHGAGAASAERRPRHAVGPDGHPALRLQPLPEQRRGRDHLPGAARGADAELRRPARADDERGAAGARVRVAAEQGHPQRRALRLSGQPVPDDRGGQHGQPRRPAALRALGDKYGLRFPGRHGSLNEPNWDNEIVASRILGQTHLGESGLPGNTAAYNSYAATLRTAQQLNRLGKRSVEAGFGPAYFHNHNEEFSTRYVDNGVLKPRVGDHHGPHRSALGRGADRHRLGRLRLRVRHAA